MARDENLSWITVDLVYVSILRIVRNDRSHDAEDIGMVSAEFKNLKRFGNVEISLYTFGNKNYLR